MGSEMCIRDSILIYGPSSDISEEEKELLEEYVSDGGKLMVMAGPTEKGTLANLYGILKGYGVETVGGIVVDTDRGHYAFRTPFVLLPDLKSNKITDPLIEERYFAIMPIAQGLLVKDGEHVTELLTTSDIAYSKAQDTNWIPMKRKRAILTVPLPWPFRWKQKTEDRSSGLPLPISWMKCITRIHQALTWIWQ